MRPLVAAALLCAATASVAVADAGVEKHLRASADGIAALLSYRQPDDMIRGARLEITRHGSVRLSAPVAALTDFSRPAGLVVRDLDADGEPEVVLGVYTGGAHCCTHSLTYRYEATRRRYALTVHDWGNVGYRIVDLDRNGRPELRSADDRFAYAFTSFAASVFPVQIWHFDQGRLVDVTRYFPAMVAADARAAWRIYRSAGRAHQEVRGALAAWLADEYRLGRAAEGWLRLEGLRREHELGPGAGTYLRQLRAFLRKLGYASP